MRDKVSIIYLSNPNKSSEQVFIKLRPCIAAIVIFLSLLGSSCSNSSGIQKSGIQIEAEKQAQVWWDASIAKCGEEFYTKYKVASGYSLTMGGDKSYFDNGYIQFKEGDYLVKESKVSESDKLNGVEWSGKIIFPSQIETPLRYYEFESNKWSSWREGPMFYSFNMSGTPNSPQTLKFKKVNGKWSNPESYFTKPQCSEIPKDN